jgi:hypothetical protein
VGDTLPAVSRFSPAKLANPQISWLDCLPIFNARSALARTVPNFAWWPTSDDLQIILHRPRQYRGAFGKPSELPFHLCEDGRFRGTA